MPARFIPFVNIYEQPYTNPGILARNTWLKVWRMLAYCLSGAFGLERMNQTSATVPDLLAL